MWVIKIEGVFYLSLSTDFISPLVLFPWVHGDLDAPSHLEMDSFLSQPHAVMPYDHCGRCAPPMIFCRSCTTTLTQTAPNFSFTSTISHFFIQALLYSIISFNNYTIMWHCNFSTSNGTTLINSLRYRKEQYEHKYLRQEGATPKTLLPLPLKLEIIFTVVIERGEPCPNSCAAQVKRVVVVGPTELTGEKC